MSRAQKALLLTELELSNLDLGALQAVAQALGVSGRGPRTQLLPSIRRAQRLQLQARVYGEWCRKPEACAGKGYCPLDPTCAD